MIKIYKLKNPDLTITGQVFKYFLEDTSSGFNTYRPEINHPNKLNRRLTAGNFIKEYNLIYELDCTEEDIQTLIPEEFI